MIDRSEILSVATDLSLSPEVVEKDYVLGWLLGGIYANSHFAPSWVFKGGTCLKKCYFETYRFSEDLDFTLLDESHLNAEFLVRAFTESATWIYDRTGIEIPADQLRFEIYPNKRGRPNCEGRIYYRGPLPRAGSGSLPRIKLDLTADEILVLPAVERNVAHPYSDAPQEGIAARCYAYEEVLAEKTRALAERTRPRDLYDVVNLFRHGEFQPQPTVVLDSLRQKCAYKGIPVPTFALLASLAAQIVADWNAMLSHQLPVLPPFESFWSQLPEFFTWLESGNVPPAVLAAPPLAIGERVVRPPLGFLRREGIPGSSSLEIIRFAAANRLCVDLRYRSEDGRTSTRRIEPYSLRRSQAGDILLFAIRRDNDQPRSYRVDRMLGADVTNESFIPRFDVELTPGDFGPVVPLSRQQYGARINRPPQRIRNSGTRRSARGFNTGITYVYQCSYCQKTFRHSRLNPQLGPHKTPDGWQCSGRTGYLIDQY